MSTNYYLKTKPGSEPCPHCGRSEPSQNLHIGKSSVGWCFSLRVYPELGINTLDDWRPLIETGVITDEYGNVWEGDYILQVIASRRRPWSPRPAPAKSVPDLEQWYRQNHAEPGPNGLARHVIDGIHCVGHSEGTWDYIAGEFS